MEDHPQIWLNEMKRLDRKIQSLHSQKDLIVFYGSSSIRLWVDIKEDLHPMNTVNIGFGGSSYQWLGYYFDKLFQDLNPSKLVFYAGENDLYHGASPLKVQHDFQKLADKSKSRFPDCGLYCINLKPSPSRSNLDEKIKETNRLLSISIPNYDGNEIINIHDHMMNSENQPNADLFLSDNLHMNKLGYAVWKKVVREYFKLD